MGVRSRLHYLLTKIAIGLGPSNPLVRFHLQRLCRKQGCQLHVSGDNLELRKGMEAMLLAPYQCPYIPYLAEKFDRYFGVVEPTLRDGVSYVDYSRPGVHRYRRSGLSFELSSFPEEEESIEGYFRWYTPRAGDRVFDIGAHCGVSTYFLSKLVGPQGRVIAFEPDRTSRSLLLRNIERHGLKNVTVVEAAVAGATGYTAFSEEGTLGSCFARCSTRGTVGRIEQVKTVSLADAFSRWGVPDFCKIDIEGAEIEVLASAVELLRRTKVQLALDTNHMLNGRLTVTAVEQLLRAAGFDVQSEVVARSMTTWARPLKLQELAQRELPAEIDSA